MSVSHEVTVWCDGNDCNEWVQDVNGITRLRAALKRRGWTIGKGDSGKDLCRECATPKPTGSST